jgi:hypothetical protein
LVDKNVLISGWGFCSKDCYPDQAQPFYGVAREKAIDILEENYCENQLTNNGAKKYKALIYYLSKYLQT